MKTLRQALLEILTRGFPRDEELRRFGDRFAPGLAAQELAVRDDGSRSLAALLVDDTLRRDRDDELIAALRRHLPSLHGFISAQLAQVSPQGRKIQPAMGHPVTPPTSPSPTSSSGSPRVETKPASSQVPGQGNEAGHTDDDEDLHRGAETEGPAIPAQGNHAPQPAGGGATRPPAQPQPQPHPHPHPHPGDLGSPATAANPSSTAARTPSPPQQLSLGFAAPTAPTAPLDKHRTLAARSPYLLWVTLSPEQVLGSLSAVAPMQGLAYDDELDVIVFPFPDQLQLDGPRHGRVRISRGGNQVVRAAQSVAGAAPATLYFKVRTPDQAGRGALRVHVYCRGILLQSHLVTAEVSEQSAPKVEALGRKLDYNLSAQLAASRFTAADGCRVSLFLNDDDHGTHSFRFVSTNNGVPDSIGDAHLDGAKLAKAVAYARGALRWAAWSSEEPWDGKAACKFADQLDAAKLEPALVGMAIRGANLYMELSAQFAFTGKASDELRQHMRTPGRVQLALKESADAIFPIGLVYDYPLDTDLKKHSLCPAALKALEARAALEAEPCFQGQCPSYGSDEIVCPGGFWGFRHDLGLPLNLRKGEVATEIPRGDKVRAFAAISTDENFTLRAGHLQALAKLGADWLEILDERKACLTRLQEARQLVYFYCHGGLTSRDVPFLQIGATDSDPISAQALFNARISWPAPLRPLVLLNGCHTTAASADDMFSMLSGFASHLNAAGVIGTEITNFELIAKLFGEKLLELFLGGEPLGRAVRLARLELLRLGNPLGLMYISFALPSLHLA